ncbi:hypothetical protein EC970259_A0092 [Escherichia coli 99.0741]|nr:hypothetical protein EC970259_A0092 [Escherichia coli 99.0741]
MQQDVFLLYFRNRNVLVFIITPNMNVHHQYPDEIIFI